jgi:hypothetical protein
MAMNDGLEININAEHRLIICRRAGLLGAEHAGQLMNFLFVLEDSNPNPFNRLLDLSLVTEIRLSSAVVYAYAMVRPAATANPSTLRTAIVAPNPSVEAAALIFATLMEDSRILANIFRDLASAAHWLGVPEKIIRREPALLTQPPPPFVPAPDRPFRPVPPLG